MTDTADFDTSEKVDILIKSAFGFPSTDEDKAWYEEIAVKYNNSLNGEDLFVEIIPDQPDFDTNGIVPLPEKGSIILSPGLEQPNTKRLITSIGF